MRFLHTKRAPERLLDAATNSVDAVRSGEHSGTLLRAALIAGGVAALTAGSAVISSLRRRMEADS
jgi:hypothetical protein